MRIIGVDPGEKRIGIAMSDPSATIASPLTVIKHLSRPVDAASIASLATENQVERIIVGQSLDEEGVPTPQGRQAARLAEAIRQQTEIPVILWDEHGSTQAARDAHIAIGASRRNRRQRGRGHLDELAATYILQSYLDSQA